jgi:hypothetical protein
MFFALLAVLLMFAGLSGRAEAKDTKKAAPAQTTTQPQGTPPAVPPASATAPLPPGAMPKMPDQYKLNLLIRTTIIAINQANKTGNYTVLRDLAAPDFQNVNSAEKLAEIFTGHIRLGCTGVCRSCVSCVSGVRIRRRRWGIFGHAGCRHRSALWCSAQPFWPQVRSPHSP